MDFELTTGQRMCVDLLEEFKKDKKAKYFVLKGHAGVGKTYLIANHILPMFPDLALTATTHKACEAINKNLGSNIAQTIHSLLSLKLKRKDDKQILVQEGYPDVPPIILVDEASMLGEDLMSFILGLNSKIIFVGDPEQQGPITEDNSSDISKCFSLDTPYKISLTEVTRQALDNPIISLATEIRESEERFDVYKAKSSNKVFKTGKNNHDLAKSVASAIQQDIDARFIAFTNSTVVNMNFAIHNELYGKTEFPFVTGERVMFNEMYAHKIKKGKGYDFRNNQECTVLNARWDVNDANVILVALKTVDDNVIIEDVPVHLNPAQIEAQVKNLFNRYFSSGKKDKMVLDEAWRLKTKYAPLRHCYAITVAKSQGSTYDVAFVDVNDLQRMRNDSVFNRALYVAVTRPRDMVILNYC